MLQEMGGRRSSLAGVVIVLAVAVFPGPVMARIEGELELLKLIANGYRVNLERLETWQGKATVELSSVSKGKEIKERSSVEFIYDREREAARWYWNQLQREIRRGQESKLEEPSFASGMVKGQSLYRFGPVPPTAERAAGLLYILPKSRRRLDGWSEDFHPMYFFRAVDGDMYARMMFYYEQANHPKISRGKVERKGDLVTLTTWSEGVTNRYEFDISQGCCLVGFFAEDPLVSGRWDLEYEQVGGVFVPKKVECKRSYSGGRSRLVRRISFEENVVNERIDPNEFSVDKLGLRPGDKIQDTVTGVKWRYRNAEVLGFEDGQVISQAGSRVAGERGVVPQAFGQDDEVNVAGRSDANMPHEAATASGPGKRRGRASDDIVLFGGKSKGLWVILVVVVVVVGAVICAQMYGKRRDTSGGKKDDSA